MFNFTTYNKVNANVDSFRYSLISSVYINYIETNAIRCDCIENHSQCTKLNNISLFRKIYKYHLVFMPFFENKKTNL